jgi:glyoxylase-like metal-dependent hydrolase (beta-lactamase superfamily II)
VVKIEKILAPNAGPFTGPGTNTWLLDTSGVVIIDPGPIIASHRSAIESAVGDREVLAVLVTHSHADHAPLANALARHYEVEALGYAPGDDFTPDRLLADGDSLRIGVEQLTVIHTPGHAPDHLCFLVDRVLFTGDHIIGGSSSMIEDASAYMSSLARLQGMDLSRLFPGHGPEIDEPEAVIDWYVAHRRQRETEILAAVQAGATTLQEVVEEVYRGVDPLLHPLAARSVQAHLQKLFNEHRVVLSGDQIQPRI